MKGTFVISISISWIKCDFIIQYFKNYYWASIKNLDWKQWSLKNVYFKHMQNIIPLTYSFTDSKVQKVVSELMTSFILFKI